MLRGRRHFLLCVVLLFIVDTVNYSKIIREFQLENERCAVSMSTHVHNNNNNQNQATLECKVYCLRPWNYILLCWLCVCVCAANNFVHIYNGWYVDCVAAMHGMVCSDCTFVCGLLASLTRIQLFFEHLQFCVVICKDAQQLVVVMQHLNIFHYVLKHSRQSTITNELQLNVEYSKSNFSNQIK